MYYSGYIQTHCQKNKKIKQADQILPEVYGTTLNKFIIFFRWFDWIYYFFQVVSLHLLFFSGGLIELNHNDVNIASESYDQERNNDYFGMF